MTTKILRFGLALLGVFYLTGSSGQHSTFSRNGLGVFPIRILNASTPGENETGGAHQLLTRQAADAATRNLVTELQRRGAHAEILPWMEAGPGESSSRASLNALMGTARRRGLPVIALVGATVVEVPSEPGSDDRIAETIDSRLPQLAGITRGILKPRRADPTVELRCEGGLLDTHTGEAVASLRSSERGSLQRAVSNTLPRLGAQIFSSLSRMNAAPDPPRDIPSGIGFTRSQYRFSVDRDYDQRLDAEVINLGNQARRVYARALHNYPDIVVDFLGAGSTATAVEMEPGQIQKLRLIATVPEATRPAYNIALQLEDAQSHTILDTVPVVLEVASRQMRLQVNELSPDSDSSVREIVITNLGDDIPDLRADLSSELLQKAIVSPSVSNARLGRGEELRLQVRPRSAFNSGRFQGDLVLNGNGGQFRYPVQLSQIGAASTGPDRASDEAYQLYRARSEYCSNVGNREVSIRGPEGHFRPDSEAFLQMRFTLRHDRATFNEHDTIISLNDREVGRLGRRIPEGTYIFPIQARWLDPTGNNKVRTKISGMSGASYSLVSDIRLLAPLDEWERLNHTSSRQRKRHSDVNLDLPDVGVFANAITRLPVAPFDGERLAIPLLVKNLGRRASLPGMLRMYNQDPRNTGAQNPLDLIHRMTSSLLQRAVMPLQRSGAQVPIPALAPGEERVLTIGATYLSVVSTRLFVVAETNDDDFDADNNVQTLTFYAPETSSPLVGIDYPNIFKAPAVGRMLRLPDRSYYRTLLQQRMWETVGREESLRGLRALFGK